MTNQDELTLVETAIQKILSGGIQEYEVGKGRRVTYVNLQQLQKRRDELYALIAREQTGAFSLAQIRRNP